MILVRQVRVEVGHNSSTEIKKSLVKKLGIKEEEIVSFRLVRESIDARKKEDVHYSYEIEVSLKKEENVLKKGQKDVVKVEEKAPIPFAFGEKKMEERPVIVGSGPAGLFAAYQLAEQGYCPLILERGETIEDRIKSVNQFFETGQLNPNSNVQFGEGGAGTFSDGKLNTLVKDKGNRCKKVFDILVENGAPEEILYLQKPHIGTNLLRNIIQNIRNKMMEMGGEIRYLSQVTDFFIEDNRLIGVEINHQEIISCHILILAIGHSARDTFRTLYEKGLKMTTKPFAVGVRICHPQKMINEAQYGKFASLLSPASYKLTYTTKKGRGVYSFCMCPGGYVINASSEPKRLVVNGMSNHERESENANSALVVTVTEGDYGKDPLDGMKYQEQLESSMYELGNGRIPVQTLEDFYHNRKTEHLKEVKPIVKGSYTLSCLSSSLPSFICDSLKEAISVFDTKIKGFGRGDALLMGIESRTSSPIRMIRDENLESNIKGIYPCGEGSGYAGGITTAAMDGIRVSEKIMSIWAPIK